jgi:hypothetical protein
MTIAHTILAQLGGVNRLKAMTGAHSFVAGERHLTFQFARNSPKNKIKYVKIILTPDDLYTVKFFQYKKFETIEVASISGIYADMLKTTIENETGLFLSL